MVYEEIVPHAHMLAIDVFANYAVQKLLGYGPTFYRRELIGKLTGSVAFEVSDMDQRIEMANDVGRNLMQCVYDQNGNHVVQKCLQCVPPKYIKLIHASFYGKAMVLSTHPYGCRVIQRVLGWCDDPEILKGLMSEIVEGVLELAIDQFGNYVIQYVVEHGGESVLAMMVMRLKGLMVMMSCQKYGSNVIEKCLTFGSIHDRLTMAAEWVVDLIVTVVNRNFFRLIHNIHGRHVLARLQIMLAARERRRLLALLTPPLYYMG
uniref:PUM-HD domain-containing protein n=1 Tax=Oryza meridionalis TaxID=40149 RepID=A0A0E0DBL4_9ORYZ